ncbi:MAG: sulfite exporter TauE/SafE family protein [Rickettsiales bacterium]
MEIFFAQCSSFFTQDYPLVLAVILAGVIGSFSYCGVVCSSLIATQILKLKEMKKSQNTIIYYHAGRISAYIIIGVLAFSLSKWLFNGKLNTYINMAIMLVGAAFIMGAILPCGKNSCCHQRTGYLLDYAISSIPVPFILYMSGLIIGFIPCAMVYSLLLPVSLLDNVYEVIFTMFIFGISTTPIIQIVANYMSRFVDIYPSISGQARRGLMVINGVVLFGVSLNFLKL